MSTTDSTLQRTALAYDGAVADTAKVLRATANHETRTDPHHGDLSTAQANLLDAVGHHLGAMPAEVIMRALAVVTAVDRLTGHRRTT